MLKRPAINSLFFAMSYHEALANVQVQKRYDHCLLLIIIIENGLIKVIKMVKKVVLQDSASDNESNDFEEAPATLSRTAKADAKHAQSKLSM